MQLTKFQSIALPLVDRGFPVTPVRPDAKAGAAGKWNLWQYTTRDQVLTKYIGKYADCNAGVVGMCGVGRLCFLDNDGGIPADVIARLPKTYTVATRPDSSHMHFYFTQTEYGVRKFGRNAKTINVRDTTDIIPSPSGGVMYRTLFDMKGIGGASLVVAAESTKPNGDKYICCCTRNILGFCWVNGNPNPSDDPGMKVAFGERLQILVQQAGSHTAQVRARSGNGNRLLSHAIQRCERPLRQATEIHNDTESRRATIREVGSREICRLPQNIFATERWEASSDIAAFMEVPMRVRRNKRRTDK